MTDPTDFAAELEKLGVPAPWRYDDLYIVASNRRVVQDMRGPDSQQIAPLIIRAVNAAAQPSGSGEAMREAILAALQQRLKRGHYTGARWDSGIEESIQIVAALPLPADEPRVDERWKQNAQAATSVIRMIRAMIGEMFGPIANIESEEATLLRGPEPKHDGDAILAALQNIRVKIDEPPPQASADVMALMLKISSKMSSLGSFVNPADTKRLEKYELQFVAAITELQRGRT